MSGVSQQPLQGDELNRQPFLNSPGQQLSIIDDIIDFEQPLSNPSTYRLFNNRNPWYALPKYVNRSEP